MLFDIQSGSDQQIQVLTREGVHVAGTASLTAAEANALMSLDSGFGEGSYSTTYLNQTGSAAYLDTTVRFGISNSEKTVTILLWILIPADHAGHLPSLRLSPQRKCQRP